MPGPGSKKQSQRTKGNTKPSSSSEAAKLLAGAGTAPTGFIGFGTLASNPAYVPASQILDDVDSNLDADFRLVLRKVMKRDSTTKVKALQELTTLFHDKDEEAVKGVLQFWPRNYNKLAIDVDYRVREATQQALNALVLRMRKSLAPYLKSLMGSWLLSQCDTYPTVASAASQAFQTAFPPAKQTDAIVFCKVETFEFLMDNILKQTPSTLSDPKSTEKEDMENKYNRVLTSSFLALRKLLTTLPSNQLNSLTEQIGQILVDPKLWKHGKSTVISIKAGIYNFLAGVCQTCPEIAAQHSEKISPYILHNLDEKDPVISTAIWEAALSLVNFVENCWKDINVGKAFWPKLRSFLSNGCYGNASYVAADLLPFVSKVPPDILGENDKFYTEFFSYFKEGLSKSDVQTSISELTALTKSFMECAHFVLKSYSKVPEKTNLARILLLDQIYPVIQVSVTEKNSLLHKTALYNMVGKISTNLESSEVLQNVVEEFWTNLSEGLDVSVDSFKGEKCRFMLERIIHFVKSLLYPDTTVKSKTDVRVKFAVEGQKTDQLVQYSGEKVELSPCAIVFIEKLTLKSFSVAYHANSSDFLHLFASLVELYPSDSTLQKVIQRCKGEKQGDQSNSSYFVFEICLPWLAQSQTSEEKKLDPQELISVLCTFVSLLEKDDVVTLLTKLTESLQRFKTFHSLFEKVMPIHNTVSGISDWLASEALNIKLVDMVTVVCSESMHESDMTEEEIQHGWDVITIVLSTQCDAIQQKMVEKILMKIQESQKEIHLSKEANKIDMAVRFVSIATQSFFINSKDCIELPSASELLLTLFSISIENLFIKEETSKLAETAWQQGFGKVVKETGGLMHEGSVLNRAADIVKNRIQKVQSAAGYEVLNMAVTRLLATVEENLPRDDAEVNPVVSSLVQRLFVTEHFAVTEQVLRYAVLKRDVSFLTMPKAQGNTELSLVAALFCTLFNASLMAWSLLKKDHPESEQSCVSLKRTLSESERETLLLMVQSWCHIQFWMEADRKAASYPGIATDLETLSKRLSVLLQNVPSADKQHLLSTVLDKCASGNFSWTLCLQRIVKCFTQNVEFTLNLDTIMERCVELTEGGVQMLQTCVPHLDIGSCSTLSELMVARLLSCPAETLLTPNGSFGALSVLNYSIQRTSKESLTDLLKAAFSQVMSWRESNSDLLLLDCQLSDVSDSQVLLNVEIGRLLELVVLEISKELNDKEWDFLLCTTVSFIESIEASSVDLLTSVMIQDFVCAVSGLLTTIAECIQVRLPLAITVYPPNLKTEWEEFFSEAAYSALLTIYNALIESLEKPKSSIGSMSQMTGCHHILLQSLGDALSLCPKQHLLDNKLPAYLKAEESSPLPDTLQSLLNHVSKYLCFNDAAVQITGFNMLHKIVSELPQYYKEVGETMETKTEEQITRSPPKSLMDIMKASSLVVRDLVHDMTLEESLTCDPFTEEYRWCLTHLLVWKNLLELFKNAPDELRQEYAGYFKEEHCLEDVMFHSIRLMPNNPSSQALFHSSGHISPKDDTFSIQHLACSVYRNTLEIMPAMVRQWWKDQDRKTAGHVDRYTSKFVSPLLCTEEIKSVNVNDTTLENITIKTRLSTREVIATYALEEVSIEIVICLPSNYPLGNITVSSEKKVGVSAAQWDKWLLQLNIFLQHQNGSIIDGLRIWKKNIDKRFDGVDDCMICYSVLHSTNFQLPRMVCKTCKKKFHSACLYKWFQTSHNSTCPLCRNLF